MAFPFIALIVGIFFAPCLDPTSVWICLPAAILIAFRKRWFALAAVALLGAGIASRTPSPPPDNEDPTAARVVCKLSAAPEWRGPGVYMDAALESVNGRPVRGRARMTEFLDDQDQRALFQALDLGAGDRLEVVVRLRRPAVYRDPGVFDYRRQLERQGIYWTGTVRNPRLITVLKRGWHGPDRLQQWIERRLERPLAARPDIEGLALRILLGRRYGLAASTERELQAAGVYHLAVVSGFHLAVVAAFVSWMARFLPIRRQARLVVVLLCALGYAAIVQGQAPVYRAAIAAGFMIGGKLLDRGYAVLNATAAAGFIILLINPASMEDSSFQMTFVAVFAVVGVGVPASQWTLGWLREALKNFDDASKDADLSLKAADWRVAKRIWCERHGLSTRVVTLPWRAAVIFGEALVISLCVDVFFAFFMVESFHRLSPVSALVNAPAGLITALVIPLGLSLLFLPGPAAAAAGWLVAALLRMLLWIVETALRIPGASIRVPSPPVWIWILYGLSAAVFVIAIHKRRAFICAGGAAAVFCLQGVMAIKDFQPAPPEKTTLTFLDVGQGDSALIEFPSGKRILIDGGGVSSGRFIDLRDESTFSIGENVVSPYLFSRGIRRLDAVVLTHAHHDHMDGLFNVIENFKVGEFWLGRNPMTDRYRDLIERIQEKQIPIRWLSSGQTVGPFTVLHPPTDWIPKKNDQNNDSLVLLLRSGNATALLTGDIERRIPVPESVEVLKTPHHGSKGVRVRPKAAVRVISVGANNPFGHPHPSSLPALRTDRLGAITVTLEPRPKVRLTESRCSCKLAFLFSSH